MGNRVNDKINEISEEIGMRHIQEQEKACWRMIGNGQLFSQGWRLAIKLDPKTLKQTTLPIAPGDPVPKGFGRVLEA